MNPPAFQLYADDFLAGTADMTAEEVGVYMRLLCHSWNKMGLENDEKRLGILVGICHGNATACANEVLARKFELGADLRWRNARQEKTRKEQENYRKTQSNNAHLRWSRVKMITSPDPSAGDAVASAVAMPLECSPSPTPTPIKTEREQHLPEANVPTWAEVKAYASMDVIAETVAREFYDHYDSKNLWCNQYGHAVNVRGCLKVWANKERKMVANGSKAASGANGQGRPAGAPTLDAIRQLCKEKWGQDQRHSNWAASFHRHWAEAKRNWQRNGRVIDWQVELSEQVSKWRREPVPEGATV